MIVNKILSSGIVMKILMQFKNTDKFGKIIKYYRIKRKEINTTCHKTLLTVHQTTQQEPQPINRINSCHQKDKS